MPHLKRLILLAIVLGAIAAGWWKQEYLRGWYCFHELLGADEKDRQRWVDRLVELGEAIEPQALACLRSAETNQCTAGEMVLLGLAKKWQDGRVGVMLTSLTEQWPNFSSNGKSSALAVARVLLAARDDANFDEALLRNAGALLRFSAEEPQLNRAALRFAAVVSGTKMGPYLTGLLRPMASRGMADSDDEIRAVALQLLMHPPLSANAELLTEAVPLLHDSASKVRLTALLALGLNEDVVSDDDLLPLLHDADADVCRRCVETLSGRGLQESHIFLATLISDPNPASRLKVVTYLDEAHDLEPGVWLRRLCQDSSPAVRAAAVRAAAAQHRADLRECLQEMAENDASPTVRQIARHYSRRP